VKAGGKQVLRLAYTSILKLEAKCSFETSVYFQRTTQSSIPEDITFRGPVGFAECFRDVKPITFSVQPDKWLYNCQERVRIH
jgi:hypothetical protein